VREVSIMGAAAVQMPESTLNSAIERELPGLMVRYQEGDPGAVEELVRRLSPRLMRFLASPGISKSDVEDLFQECWVRIHRARHTYRPTEPLLPWIYAVARHTRLDAYRRRRRLESREVLVSEPPEPASQPPRVDADQDPSRFGRLLTELPESQREVIFMLKVSGMSIEEVARATSSTVGAIKQKAHRAYGTLRRILEKEGRSICLQN
jgi:RNA polymerase sigma-70 factor, ECF subfamily